MFYKEKFKHLFDSQTWLQGLFLFLCGWMLMVMVSIITLLTALQFIYLLCTGTLHNALKDLGYVLNRYTGELAAYLTFQKKQPPFPFS